MDHAVPRARPKLPGKLLHISCNNLQNAGAITYISGLQLSTLLLCNIHFSRISRSLPDLLKTLDFFSKKGVAFVSLKERIDTSGATGKLIVSVLGAINAYEREINAERREYAYRKSCQEGRVGRPKAQPDKKFETAVAEWRKGKITATEAIAKAGISRTTFYKLVKAQTSYLPIERNKDAIT